nr:MAG TPA: Protein of unknown function (DUF551) [Bacteriophage sp.]
MNDYIKREDALKLFAGGGKYPEGSFQRRLGELGERLVMQIPFANVVEGDEYDRVRRALAWMWYAYVNKDGECPHDFEARAVEMAEEVLGKWEDCMPQLMREAAPVARRGKWIKTEDEQPEKSGLYLGVEAGMQCVRIYECIRCWGEYPKWFDTHWHDQCDVIYWMPLPAPPKGMEKPGH